jgi:histidinol-phosphate aminotransferase
MSDAPHPTPLVASLPASKPFVGPEELARRVGRTSLVRLGANESAFGPPPRALDAMREALAHISFYGDPENTELREAIAARHGCAPEHVVIGSGIDELLGLAVRAYLAPGDVTVATYGSYPTYVYHVVGFGVRLETVPYADDGTVRLDALAARARDTNARVVYLANPDNPSGSFAPRREVARFIDALPRTTLLILDEAYGDFVPPSELVPLDVANPRVLRMRTFSKAYGLAGARVAYALGAPGVARVFDRIRLHFGVNRAAQAGALAALEETAFVADVVAAVARGRDEYRALAARHGLATLPSHTNFVCFDLGSRARAEAMVAAMLERGVFIRKPGAPPLDGYVRVTVGTAADRAHLVAAFDDALASLGPPAAKAHA